MTDLPRVEWAGGGDRQLAECAEAIGCKVDQILSTTWRPYGLLVMWTPEPMDRETFIVGTVLQRDNDEILRVVRTGPTDTKLGEFIDRIERDMKERKVKE